VSVGVLCGRTDVHAVPDRHHQDDLRPADVAFGDDVSGDVEGGGVRRRRDIVVQRDLRRHDH